MSEARASLSVVVPTRDRPESLSRCLAALRTALGPDDELVVVDSASVDPSSTVAAAARADARLVRCARPGAAAARNAGWREARHDLVAFVDDDVVVGPGWAAAMASCFSAYPETAFVTGRTGADDHDRTMTVAVKDDDAAAELTRTSGGVLGHSANLAVRRDVLAAVGGFDEALGAGARWRAAEDTDLFDRILACGRTGRYAPDAAATHEQWRRIREWVRLQHGYGIGSGARLSKLRRLDPDRYRLIRSDDVRRWGFAQLPGELARRDWYRAAGTVLRLAGIARGFAAAAATPVRDGHFRPARSRRASSSS